MIVWKYIDTFPDVNSKKGIDLGAIGAGIKNLRRKALGVNAYNVKLLSVMDVSPSTWRVKSFGPLIADKENKAPIESQLRLHLDYVHGYDGSKIFYGLGGNIIYSVDKIGIIWNRLSNSQLLYNHHEGIISSLSLEPTHKCFVASGEFSNNKTISPKLHIWSAHNGEQVIVLNTPHKNSISHIEFGDDGKWMVTVGNGEFHTIAIWRSPSGKWNDSFLQASQPTVSDNLLWIKWTGHDEYPLVHGGSSHIIFWNVNPTSGVISQLLPFFGSKGKNQPLHCSCMFKIISKDGSGIAPSLNQSCLITGTESGHLYIWNNPARNNSLTVHASVRGHRKPIILLSPSTNDLLVSVDKGGNVAVWNKHLEIIFQFNIFNKNDNNISIPKHIDWDCEFFSFIFVEDNGNSFEISQEGINNIFFLIN